MNTFAPLSRATAMSENRGANPPPESNDDSMQTVDFAAVSNPNRGSGKLAGYEYRREVAPGERYTRSSLHAEGGMGRVWLAHDGTVGRDVAIKELRNGQASGLTVARFVREARITGQLEHPGIVPVYELGSDPKTGEPFYVMRFVRGRTLTDFVKEFHRDRSSDPMLLVRLLAAFVSVCHTVAYAHSRGIIHRDLKGENVILGEFGEAIVLDWGLAKRLDGTDEDGGSAELATATPDSNRTMAGQAIGTPSYMAPEQAQGRQDLIGPRTDIFGLGAILYEILTGEPPFTGATPLETLSKAAAGVVVPPSTAWPEIPAGLEAICLKALSPSPDDRHPTATALGLEVQGWQDRQRRKAEDELRAAFERLRRQQATMVALTRSEVLDGPDLTTIFGRLIEAAARTLGVERVSIWRFTPDRKAIRCDALYELSTGRLSSGAELRADAYPAYFAALAETDVIAADDAQNDPRTREFTDGYLVPLGIGAMMEVPIHPDGVLCHEHVGPPRKWLPDEQLFGIAVGNLAAHVISYRERRRASDT